MRLLFILACILLPTLNIRAGQAELYHVYQQIKPALDQNAYGIPVYINSRDEDNTMIGVIYGVIKHPFVVLSEALRTPANWCEIAPLHLNVKACTYQSVKDYCQLVFYSGRKFYEKADDVYQLAYRFEVMQQDRNFVDVRMSAADGPAGTSDYQLKIQAIPLTESLSFLYFSYSYKYNFITSMGMGTYLATLGRGKLGFSITGKDDKGNPIYVEGVRGIIERNAVRYYLAIQSYLDTLDISTAQRFKARISKWFDLTEKHHLQLYEMDKTDYLQYKQQEHKDQQRLQQEAMNPTEGNKHCQANNK